MKKMRFITIGGAALLFAANSGFATMVSTTADYQVSIAAACSVDASGQNFGTYPSGTGQLLDLAGGQVSVTCPANTTYRVGMDYGLAYDGNYRNMVSGNNFVQYAIYTVQGDPFNSEFSDVGLETIDPAYTVTYPWGSSIAGTGDGTLQSYNLLGFINFQGTEPNGNYTDTVTVTVVW